MQNTAITPSSHRTPRNAEDYVARRVFMRDKPFLASTVSSSSSSNNSDPSNSNNYDHKSDRLDSIQGILPEQYKSKPKQRPSERRNNAQHRVEGKGWDCPNSICYRNLGEMVKTTTTKRSSPNKRNHNNNDDGDGDGEDAAATLVAQRLQDAQSMFGGEEIKNRAALAPPSTQLGHFTFPRWKPTYHSNGGASRHVDEKLYESLKRSDKRVNHAKVCGGGGSRIKKIKAPPPIQITHEDLSRIFDDDNDNNNNTNPNPATQLPIRPQPPSSSLHTLVKHGHEVMSPRVAKLLRDGNTDTLHKEYGAPPSVYLPYSSRHPRTFPLRLLSYREYARSGGSGISDTNNDNDSRGDASTITTEKRLELAARRMFEASMKEHTKENRLKYKDVDERRIIKRDFYKKMTDLANGVGNIDHRGVAHGIGRMPASRKKNRSNKSELPSGRRRKRPPTAGLPRKKMDRPAERLHQVAQTFVTCRVSADNALLTQLETIEKERQLTIRRKKQGMTAGNILSNRPDWTWVSEVRSMRLVADVTVLEEMLEHAKKHVWYMSMVKEIHDHQNDPSKIQLYIIDFIYRVLSFGMSFDSNCFIHLLCALDPSKKDEEFEPKIIQDMLHNLKEHTQTTLEVYNECSFFAEIMFKIVDLSVFG